MNSIAQFTGNDDAQPTVPPSITLNPETHAMSQKDRIIGQNPSQKGFIQEKIAHLTGDDDAQPTVPSSITLNPETHAISQ